MSPAVPLPVVSDRRSFVVIIGVDPHKRTHTASALEPGSHRVLATLQIDATLAGYRQLARWAARFEVRRWAVENARGLGRHLAQWLAARGEHVDDVPCTATARLRELSRGGRRKELRHRRRELPPLCRSPGYLWWSRSARWYASSYSSGESPSRPAWMRRGLYQPSM